MEIIDGFESGCNEIGISYRICEHIENKKVREKEAYLIIEDSDLLDAVEIALDEGWQIGRDIGILSYNEMAMKRVVASRISTISNNFALMGKKIVQMILSGKPKQIYIPTEYVNRNSV